MDGNTEIDKGRQDIPTQTFRGKTYYLYEGEKYFSKGTKRLHRVVWEYFKGEIPKDYHIHHINGDTQDNRIENLSVVHKSLHMRFTTKKRHKDNPEWSKEFYTKGIEAAKEWHKSDEGRKWHVQHGKNCWINRPTFLLNCQVCGKEYKTPFPTRSKYCHNNCKAKALRDRRKQKRDGL